MACLRKCWFKLFVGLVLIGATTKINAQDSLFTYSNDDREPKFGGISAYYFWELDSQLYIKENTYKQAFYLNKTIQSNRSFLGSVSDSLVMKYIKKCAYDKKQEKNASIHSFDTLNFSIDFITNVLNQPNSILYIKENELWSSKIEERVLYFNVYSDSTRRFSHSNDSIVLLLRKDSLPALGHYIVKRFWNDLGELVDEQVFTFSGLNVTNLLDVQQRKPSHFIVFSNGYRGRKTNKDETDNLVTRRDRYHYWLRLDKAFVKRIKPEDYFYIDGNHSISTSNHRTKVNFSLSYGRIKALRKKEANRFDFHLLNLEPNDSGFYQRVQNGRIAGKAFLVLRSSERTSFHVKDTLDIVCHSMGYAYVLGFLEEVKDFFILRNCYIIAPENASAGCFNWSLFQEVWQYGTHIEQPDPEPIWKQDGIAPQVSIIGLENCTNCGRVYFPQNYKKMNFVNSHMLNHYRWIFKDIQSGKKGFVH